MEHITYVHWRRATTRCLEYVWKDSQTDCFAWWWVSHQWTYLDSREQYLKNQQSYYYLSCAPFESSKRLQKSTFTKQSLLWPHFLRQWCAAIVFTFILYSSSPSNNTLLFYSYKHDLCTRFYSGVVPCHWLPILETVCPLDSSQTKCLHYVCP